MRHLLFATRNAQKTREFASILGPEFAVTDLTGDADAPEVQETGRTFEENAALKAVTISRFTGGIVVGDDSGLEVDALAGAPGIYSARYAGEQATDADNVAKLLSELRAAGIHTETAAQFRCVLALARGGSLLRLFRGTIRGVVTLQPAGADGFGYDPVFKPEGVECTFAQVADTAKNAISHRAQAAAQLRAFLTKSASP